MDNATSPTLRSPAARRAAALAAGYAPRKLAHVPSYQHVRWQAAENDNSQRGERARKAVRHA